MYRRFYQKSNIFYLVLNNQETNFMGLPKFNINVISGVKNGSKDGRRGLSTRW